MLKYVSSNQSYISFLDSEKQSLSFSEQKHLHSNKLLRSALWRFRKLNMDAAVPLLIPLYSSTGRPANDPTILFRSFLLMLKMKCYSIAEWCRLVQIHREYQFVIGSWNVPGVASHYDFISRLTDEHMNLKTFFPKGKYNRDVRVKLHKNEKWENFTDEDTSSLTTKYWDNADCDNDRATLTLEKLLRELAVRPSRDLGLIPDNNNLTACGDGSALHIHSSKFGHHVHDCTDEVNNYRYSAPDADIGWDSDLGVWYLGYHLFNISCHSAEYKVDLPLYVSIGYASTHDALTTVSATAKFFDLYPDIHPVHMAFDSAMDAYPIYKWLRHRDTIPIIDWNKRTTGSKKPYAEFESRDPDDGTPICACGHRMIRDGYDTSKMATKFRCPVKMGKLDFCPLMDQCTSSPYGRVIKNYDKTNWKLFGPIPYRSERWKEIYKDRTCTERINNRMLNDYGLHKLHIRSRGKFFFFAILSAICIHMDAWVKASKN